METEKMKMAAGRLYDANYDEELLAERVACAELLYDLNRLRPSQEAERQALLRRILGCVKGRLTVVGPFFCDYGYNIVAGDGLFLNTGTVILDEARVTFGKRRVRRALLRLLHGWASARCGAAQQGLEFARPITVEDNVWIGGGVTVLPGVTIGEAQCRRGRKRGGARRAAPCRGGG